MIKRILTLLILMPAIALAVPNDASAAFEKILGSLKSMTANFQQKTFNSKGKLLQQASGTMAVERPKKFRWYTLKPNKQLIVTDGNLLWIYDVDLEQASVRYLKKLQNNTPAMLLSGSASDIEKNYQIELVKQQQTQQIFKLTPKQQQGVFQQLHMAFNNNQLIRMEFKDNLGQFVKLNFSAVKVNPNIAANQFTFKPPAGVDVIGAKKQ